MSRCDLFTYNLTHSSYLVGTFQTIENAWAGFSGVLHHSLLSDTLTQSKRLSKTASQSSTQTKVQDVPLKASRPLKKLDFQASVGFTNLKIPPPMLMRSRALNLSSRTRKITFIFKFKFSGKLSQYHYPSQPTRRWNYLVSTENSCEVRRIGKYSSLITATYTLKGLCSFT